MALQHPCTGTWLAFPGKSNPSVKSYDTQLQQAAAAEGGGWALLPPEHLSGSHMSTIWILTGLRKNSLIVRSSHGAPEPN